MDWNVVNVFLLFYYHLPLKKVATLCSVLKIEQNLNRGFKGVASTKGLCSKPPICQIKMCLTLDELFPKGRCNNGLYPPLSCCNGGLTF